MYRGVRYRYRVGPSCWTSTPVGSCLSSIRALVGEDTTGVCGVCLLEVTDCTSVCNRYLCDPLPRSSPNRQTMIAGLSVFYSIRLRSWSRIPLDGKFVSTNRRNGSMEIDQKPGPQCIHSLHIGVCSRGGRMNGVDRHDSLPPDRGMLSQRPMHVWRIGLFVRGTSSPGASRRRDEASMEGRSPGRCRLPPKYTPLPWLLCGASSETIRTRTRSCP